MICDKQLSLFGPEAEIISGDIRGTECCLHASGTGLDKIQDTSQWALTEERYLIPFKLGLSTVSFHFDLNESHDFQQLPASRSSHPFSLAHPCGQICTLKSNFTGRCGPKRTPKRFGSLWPYCNRCPGPTVGQP